MATPAAPATSVFALRTRLDELRQRITKLGAVREIVGILRDNLGVRADVTIRTLVETGIGITVNRLSMHRGDPAVAAAAMPILDRWRKMEAATINAAVTPAKGNIPPGEGPPLITTPMVSND